MSKQITVTVNGGPRLAQAGATLSEIIKGEKPCGGHGKCGKCRVIAKGALSPPAQAELTLLSREELARGVRLSCLARALGDCEIVVLSHCERAQILDDGIWSDVGLDPAFAGYGVAVDLGTTTVAARLYDASGDLLANASRINPQQAWGADVISRIEAALSGRESELSAAIRQAVDAMICELAATAKIDCKKIDGAVITGNTVMLSLLCEESVAPLSRAPFAAKRLFGETLSAVAIGLSSLCERTPVYFPPCISAFVGADITCAILSTGLCTAETAMLADIGTNGELALWHKGSLAVCSTAAGPAFEGVGISMGMRGADGAIDRVCIGNGTLKPHVIGDTLPIGICGSGLVDAVACMLDLGLIDESGSLEDELVIQEPVRLVPKDIRMLQLAKSAICAGITTLMESKGLSAADVATLYVAGGFGSYLNKESAARIGLIPRALSRSARAVGNAALSGAAMLLLNKKIREEAQGVARRAQTVDLASNPMFSEKYMMNMTLEEV